jgi:hypothetical protein
MARRQGAFRNLLVILGLFVLADILVILLPLLRRSEPILPPESPEIIARRQAPENAYAVLKEAVNLLPRIPPAVLAPDKEVPKVMVKYEPAERSLGRILNIARPDDDPKLTAYLADCEKAISKTRDALTCPYYLLPPKPEMQSINDFRNPLHKTLGDFHQLGAVLNARGLQSIRAGDCAGAWAWMRDAVRLALLMRNDCRDIYWNPDGISGSVMDCLNIMLPACPIETLEQVEADIKAFDAELKPSISALESYLREADQYPLGFSPNARDGPARLLYAVNASLMRRSIRSWARRNLDGLFEAFQRPYPEANRGLEQAKESDKAGNAADALRHIRRLIVSDALAKAVFRGATLVVALERYRRVHAAYPESLDALVPGQLDSALEDPFTGSAFVYRRVDKDYQLYSLGWGQSDDGGATIPDGKSRSDSDDVVIHWPPTP